MSNTTNLPVRLRRATLADLDTLVTLRNEPTSVRYSKRGILTREDLESDYLKNPSKIVYLAESHKEGDIGFAILEKLGDDIFEISVALKPEFRGGKRARPLILLATKHAAKAHGAVEVLATIAPGNTASIRSFEAAGYRLTALKPGEAFATYHWLAESEMAPDLTCPQKFEA